MHQYRSSTDGRGSKAQQATLISLSRFQSTVAPKAQKFEEDAVPEGWSREVVNLEYAHLIQLYFL